MSSEDPPRRRSRRDRPSRSVQLSDTDWTVMNAVWSAPPATAREVLELCGGETGWAYTTVKTLLDRLVEKGALAESKRGKVSVYQPLISKQQARRSALRRLVDRAFGGALPALVHHLVDVEGLSPDERAELEAVLRTTEETSRSTEDDAGDDDAQEPRGRRGGA